MIYLKRPITSVLSLLVFASAAASAHAGDVPSTVVELFTSQGCSSCPPANAFVGALTEDTDKLVLSYGVTYWDYLGWKDTFGDVRFTERQKAYGKAFGIGNVYTPQIVLNGSAHSPRYQRRDIDTMPLNAKGGLDIDVTDGQVVITGLADVDSTRPIVLVSFTPGWQSVDVSKGENNGRTLRLANVVTDVQPITTDQTAIRASDDTAYAVLVHDAETKKILNAAVYRP
ncbi:DUF1223 domain-containing protein [Fretibacter rubidus]|uniref:DUF1223 domain-containing protein n=1 Tax=Fretibacter rubidus TaxID=570162 RepID=UPI00352A2C23